ncbi:MAG: DUF433 domain-containing protein [Planctomycetaceae bacterium]|nr:DUF433 domain-containing protein [Planctomycetaceae bacterium]
MPKLDRITFEPGKMGGKPCIRGMRVTVGTVVGLVAAGHSIADILDEYPYLEHEDVMQSLAYAAWRAEEIEFPLDDRAPIKHEIPA